MIPRLELPTYTITLPSNKAEIIFRPFTVKERSILLVALQDGKPASVLRAINDVFKVCTFGKCELDKMPIVDAEYLFINIRNKSVGEDLNIIHTCECGKNNDVGIDMGDISVTESSVDKDINLGGDNWVKMTYPTFKNSALLADAATEDAVITVIASCIESIIQGSDVFKAQDNTIEDLREFVLSLTQPQLDAIENFFRAIPKVQLKTSYTCTCGVKNDIVIEGLENFFG